MNLFRNAGVSSRPLYYLTFLLLLTAAFIQAYRATSDLTWYCIDDFNRDLAFARGFLNDGFGKDPNFVGQFIWYNPLLTMIEATISHVTGYPLNVVLSRAGVYLDLLCPIAFFLMLTKLMGWKRALAGVVSYIFLASGMLPPFYTATYSAWAFPNCFIQFIFFLNILFVYKAYQTENLRWFALLGFSIGISFLGHTSPTVLILLILVSLHSIRMFRDLRQKDYRLLGKHLLQGIVTFLPFLLMSFPLLYYIVGKYHLRTLNRAPFEFVDGIFVWHNWREMLRANLSIFLAVSVFGFIWFFRNEKNRLLRQIFFSWLGTSVFMYLYSSAIVGLNAHYHIKLPGTVPSFHYFVYLKALQSVFFGYGFLPMAGWCIDWCRKKWAAKSVTREWRIADFGYALMLVLIVAAWFPRYSQRPDFVALRNDAKTFEADSLRLGVYNYIIGNIPEEKVILCGEHTSLFPMMPTARKMVSIGTTFSNPYLDFDRREADRNDMMEFIKTGAPTHAEPLLDQYGVGYVLVENDSLRNGRPAFDRVTTKLYSNAEYSIYSIGPPTTSRD